MWTFSCLRSVCNLFEPISNLYVRVCTHMYSDKIIIEQYYIQVHTSMNAYAYKCILVYIIMVDICISTY